MHISISEALGKLETAIEEDGLDDRREDEFTVFDFIDRSAKDSTNGRMTRDKAKIKIGKMVSNNTLKSRIAVLNNHITRLYSWNDLA